MDNRDAGQDDRAVAVREAVIANRDTINATLRAGGGRMWCCLAALAQSGFQIANAGVELLHAVFQHLNAGCGVCREPAPAVAERWRCIGGRWRG